ncbi:hypothetical protein L2E82_47811 [Cichorium intybus]|uniref:Uncharacterized protein n=1 Tax=Cichorium intybus TaxID=13427 RepID=A0ACB8YWL7_CICIN|nr:hypothetical protein L2E82_47811 [Cichorium intybus]
MSVLRSASHPLGFDSDERETQIYLADDLRRYQSQSPVCLIVLVEKLGRQQLIMPKIHMVGRRSISTRVTSASNSPGLIDSPLMQSMQNKVR